MRDAGRKLSELRDMQVLADTVDQLKEKEELPSAAKPALERMRGIILRRKEELFRQAEQQNELPGVVEKLREIRTAISAWPLERITHETLMSAFEESMQRGQLAFAAALKNQQDEDFHNWRKRTKDVRYQLEFLHKMWTDVLSGYAANAKQLEQALGKDHDLAVLRGMIPRKTSQEKKDAALLAAVIRDERKVLRKEAESTGQLLYGESPKLWAERLERCWQAWK
jgi:CHAD domain-containing protein